MARDFNATSWAESEKKYPDHLKTWSKRLIQKGNVFKPEITYTNKIITWFVDNFPLENANSLHGTMVEMLWRAYKNSNTF